MQPLDYEQTFPPSIAVPAALRQLRDWLAVNGYPLGGSFELRTDEGGDTIRSWFGHDGAVDRLAVFGAGADGSPYALWCQEDGRLPVVHLGSEGDANFVLAAHFVDFLRLLAVGYDEIGFDDLSVPPGGQGSNPALQRWVEETFRVDVPRTGEEITTPARASHEDFAAWVERMVNEG